MRDLYLHNTPHGPLEEIRECGSDGEECCTSGIWLSLPARPQLSSPPKQQFSQPAQHMNSPYHPFHKNYPKQISRAAAPRGVWKGAPLFYLNAPRRSCVRASGSSGSGLHEAIQFPKRTWNESHRPLSDKSQGALQRAQRRKTRFIDTPLRGEEVGSNATPRWARKTNL